MENNDDMIKIETLVNAPIEKVWKLWTDPAHILKWNNASDEWHTTKSENDLRQGGKFFSRMEAKDGSFGFDFEGTYQQVKPNEYLEYTIGDGRKVKILFIREEDKTKIQESFDAENTHSEEVQRSGWQSILDNFKKYAELNN